MLTVASIGAIDPHDISKIVVAGSVVQLGGGVGGVESVAREGLLTPELLPVLPQISATIRYDVAFEGVTDVGLGSLGLQVRYRDGNGRVIATLMEVDHSDAVAGDPDAGTIREQALLQFDSAYPGFGGASASFRTHIATLSVDSSLRNHALDFGSHSYYIALSLTGPGVVVAFYPPAVSTLGLVGVDQG